VLARAQRSKCGMHCLWVYDGIYTLSAKTWQQCQDLIKCPHPWICNSSIWSLPKEADRQVHPDLCPWLCIGSIIYEGDVQDQPKCPARGDGLNKHQLNSAADLHSTSSLSCYPSFSALAESLFLSGFCLLHLHNRVQFFNLKYMHSCILKQ
jgi:hypothetical protein